MRLSIIQMNVVQDKAENLAHASDLIARAAADGAEMAVLPEMFCCPYTNASFVANAEPEDGPVCGAMSRAAEKNRIWLIAGSMPEAAEGKIYNASFVFDPAGRRTARHRKVHLFDIDVKGGQHFRESDTFTRGDSCTVFDTPWGKVGLCICFDMRFPELQMHMALLGAEIIAAPAAFNMTTGPAHWDMLFRQRAVDAQCFTIGAAPARDPDGEYVSYANSILCDPWGTVLAHAGISEEILTADLDMDRIRQVRSQLPLLSARVPEVYGAAADRQQGQSGREDSDYVRP